MAGAVALLVVAGGLGVSRVLRRETVVAPPPVVATRLPSLVKLTHESRAFDPAISPDGRFVAFKVLRDGESSVWLKEIARGSSTVVMPPSRFDYRGLTFSPDGGELFFKTFRDDEKNALIMRVPILGGAPRDVARNVWSDFAVSPDGHEVAFVRSATGKGATMAVMVARADGSAERKVAESVHATTWFALWESAPSWSPDGRRIALCGWRRDAAGDHPRLYDVDVSTGATREMAIPPEWTSVSQVAWLGDGSGLVVSATTEAATTSQLWLLDPSGKARRITNDTSGYRKLKLSADARLLVVEQHLRDDHLWILPEGDTSRARQMTVGMNDADGYYGVAWTPDRRVLFVSDRTGQNEIWSMRPDGTDVRQITTGSPAGNLSVDVSPDGKHIVFVTDRGGRSNVWRVDADGRNPKQLTRGDGESRPDVSPDGRWVYYVNSGVTPSRIERVPIDGGAPVAFPTGTAAGSPAVSPDGTMIAIDHYDEERGWRNGVMPAAGGEPRLFAWHSNRGLVRWAVDSRSLLYIDGANLWRQPLDGGPARQVTHFPPGVTIWNFAVAPDGRDLAIVRGAELSDIVLIRDFR